MDQEDKGKPGANWHAVVEAFRAYADADDEDDRAFELARERLQAKALEWVERRPGPRRPPSSG